MEIQKGKNIKDSFKKNKVVTLTLHNIRTYYKASVNKSTRYWHKDRQTERINATDSSIWTAES